MCPMCNLKDDMEIEVGPKTLKLVCWLEPLGILTSPLFYKLPVQSAGYYLYSLYDLRNLLNL